MSDTRTTSSWDDHQSEFWKKAWDGTEYYDYEAAEDAIMREPGGLLDQLKALGEEYQKKQAAQQEKPQD